MLCAWTVCKRWMQPPGLKSGVNLYEGIREGCREQMTLLVHVSFNSPVSTFLINLVSHLLASAHLYYTILYIRK